MRTVAIVQARLGSTRLPGKVLLPLPNGMTILETVLRQVGRCRDLNEVVLVTPNAELADTAWQCGARCSIWFGERDTVGEFYFAAYQAQADVIARITSDCPMITPEAISWSLEEWRAAGCDYFYNGVDGCDVEVFSFPALHEAFHNAQGTEREHVGLYVKRHGTSVVTPYPCIKETFSVDTQEHYVKCCELMRFDNGNPC